MQTLETFDALKVSKIYFLSTVLYNFGGYYLKKSYNLLQKFA